MTPQGSSGTFVTCDFFDCPEVLQLCWVHGGDFVMGIPVVEEENQ